MKKLKRYLEYKRLVRHFKKSVQIMGDRYSCVWENSKIFSDEEVKAIYDKIVLKMEKR